MMVNKLTHRLSEQNINIVVTDKAKEKLQKKDMILNMVLDHSLEQFKTVEDNLSELILDGNKIEGKEVTIDHDGKEFKYDIYEITAKKKQQNHN